MRPGLKSAIFHKIIELGELCCIKKENERYFSFFIKPVSVVTLYEISALNFEVSARKYAMKKFIFLARIYVEKFRNLIKICNNYEGSKCQTIVTKHKILTVFFS